MFRNMERLSHDLNLALEESNCCRHERRKLGMRRRTRSAGNLPTVTVSLVEDGSSSSPPQAPLITQPLSDSDDPHVNINTSTIKSRRYCQVGNFESDSFNENFSPTRPANTRRKRKFKKLAVDYTDGKHSPPIEILSITTEPNILPATITLQTQSLSPLIHVAKQKHERNAFCGKRKWSHRDRGDGCEMRERSFSGGCSSKSSFFKNDLKSKKHEGEKRRKEALLQPGKIVLKSHNTDDANSSLFANTSSLPGSSSFNFVYRNSKSSTPTLSKFTGYKITTDLPPFFNPTTSNNNNLDSKSNRKFKILSKSLSPKSLRNPFDDNAGMDCGNESSSLSSSDSDGANDSDREGDDELTDWPGIEELKVFNKSLTFKSSKAVNNNFTKSISNTPPPKRLKKENVQLKCTWTGNKSRYKKKRAKVDSGNDDDMMSDSKTIVDVDDNDDFVEEEKEVLPHSSLTTFSEVKNAGISGENADEQFFQSFQAFQKKTGEQEFKAVPRTNFTLQKTSSSDLNISEKSPQSDHYYSEHSMANAGISEVREIRAGCRRIREERPGFLILSAANEQLSKFLQDSCQTELKLPSLQDPAEKEKLESLAKLYSLELQIEMGRPVLRKTSNTMQAVRVEHSYHNFPSDHKRRCYGEDADSSLSLSDGNSIASINDLEPTIDNSEVVSKCDATKSDIDTFSDTLVDKTLLHDPGDLD
ncbi:uncharacterized protein LOC126974264 isoform X2 [Leptidea sinapis]|uniref:uncharacterized protein LOC126974264 isoform X2 n=2 Tax=Leptidea sinapis TaxID=189913 RepID=UPI0021C3F54A|nr:uncharacterized protein LOC126974264 isoform X2 [Leptidea sinapis]